MPRTCHLRLVDASVRYDDASLIFERTSLHLSNGWTGIVGPNGSGKTTLLELLAAARPPWHGTRACDPLDAVVHLCPQVCDSRAPSAAIEAFAWAFDRAQIRLLDRLRLTVEHLERWPTLSPGERKRWQIGAALHAAPDVLLLDEPTNHVDRRTRALLVDALSSYGGVGVVVSHDRDLLDAVTAATVRVQVRRPGMPAAVEVFDGSYGRARAAWEHQAAEARVERGRAVQRVARRQEALQAAQEHRSQKESRQRRVQRLASHRDHDAHSSSVRGRLAHAVTRASASAGLARAALERANAALVAHQADVVHGGAIALGGEAAPSNILMAIDPAELRVGDRPLRGPRLWLERNDRVWLAGPSGAGKSTLAAALVARWPWEPQRCFVLPQDLQPAQRSAALAAVETLDATSRGAVFSVVANLGCDPDRVRWSALPSPGEARKLLLGLAVATSRWLLVLDEPSNDLDLPAIERLEAALSDYPGALLLVTHDARLARRVCTRIWTIDDEGTVHVDDVDEGS